MEYVPTTSEEPAGPGKNWATPANLTLLVQILFTVVSSRLQLYLDPTSHFGPQQILLTISD